MDSEPKNSRPNLPKAQNAPSDQLKYDYLVKRLSSLDVDKERLRQEDARMSQCFREVVRDIEDNFCSRSSDSGSNRAKKSRTIDYDKD